MHKSKAGSSLNVAPSKPRLCRMLAKNNTMLAEQLSSASLLMLLVAAIFSGCATFSSAGDLTSEAETLLQFKQGLSQTETLSRWTAANLAGVCDTWEGVICSNSNTVTGLNFTNFNVSGELTRPLCDLPNLAELRIRSNSFTQTFPGFIIQFCKQLTVIDFSLNHFYGQLPVNISTNLSKLQVFDMEGNNFNGRIPPDLGNLSQLRLLRLRGNNLSGVIPLELGSLSVLQILDLSWNSFHEQEIPKFLSNLSSLQQLDLPGCNFIGEIPDFIGNLSHLWFLSLRDNSLSGLFPPSLGNLHNITELYLFDNFLSGAIPPFNASNFPHISILQVQNNSLNGTIPASLGSLSTLTILRLDQNLFSGALPDTFSTLPNLTHFLVYNNNLHGTLSSDWGLHSTLVQFDVTGNQFTGAFPPHLCRGNGLLYLSLQSNLFTGQIPEEYGSCVSVLRFVVNINQLSGSVPSGIWTLPNVQVLNLQLNNFSGEIILQDSGAASGNLQTVFLGSNQFEGPLPSEIGRFWFNLTKLTASQNKLSGPIPLEIGLLSSLETLELSANAISGEIPTSIGDCSSLTSLILSHNDLSGGIPAQLSQIENLNYIDLSNNNLSGSIPTSLAKSTYGYFNVSYNDLSGVVPEQLARAFNSASFEGNPHLCLPLQACNFLKQDSGSGKANIRLLVPIVVLVVCAALLCVALTVRMCRKRRKGKSEVVNDWTVVSFQKLGFNERELYERLDENNVIGRGGSGRVYKVFLESLGQTVAVKNLTYSRAFTTPKAIRHGFHLNKKDENSAFKAEMEILGKIQHRNIVKLLCSCACADAKLLVYEYMCNGSLGDVLHKAFRNELLSWATRFQIALGAAEALAYLHHDCVPPILHRDIKSNNILLDSSFQAKLGDFGVAKSFQSKAPMTGVVGSVGYIAPEYAYTLKVDEKSDVYSYGVVLLELLTGRSPASKEFASEGIELVRWVRKLAQSKEGLWELFDCRLDVAESNKESMCGVLKVALLCTCELPRQRPSMREVVEFLHQATPISTLPSFHHHDWDKSKRVTISIMT